MDLSTEKQRPQLVEVVNNSINPTQTEVMNLPVSGDGTSVLVRNVNSYILGLSAGSTTTFIVTFDNILILNADGGFAALPLNTTLYNVTQSQINTALSNIKNAYSALVANATAATLHYCQFNNSKTLQSFSYDLKSND